MVYFLIKQKINIQIIEKHYFLSLSPLVIFEKMDMENIRQVLEDAAQTFLSAANTITNERRREAEKVSWVQKRIDTYFQIVLLIGFSPISSFTIFTWPISIFNRTFIIKLCCLSNTNCTSRRYRQRMVVVRRYDQRTSRSISSLICLFKLFNIIRTCSGTSSANFSCY